MYNAGYWEWLKDVLAQNISNLIVANIYDDDYVSLFTFDHDESLVQFFCRFWCSSTNNLHTLVVELLISLWDLNKIGGLSIYGKLYDDVIPMDNELMHEKTYKHLFSTYYKLYGESETHQVTICDWIKFWYKGPSRYA